jgi:uncharacterized protein YjbI with pentapeptide repeats
MKIREPKDIKIKEKTLQEILDLHSEWCLGEKSGVRADLREANLRGADLNEADIREADIREADLRGANLRGADLREANLRGANLRGADLREANLRGANLRGAKFNSENKFLNGIKCKFIFFFKDGIKIRIPERGDFEKGEFEKLINERYHFLEKVLEKYRYKKQYLTFNETVKAIENGD